MGLKFRLTERMLSEVLLREIGESNIEPYEYYFIDEYRAEFIVDSSFKVDVKFDKLKRIDYLYFVPDFLKSSLNEMYNIEFSIGGNDIQQFKSNSTILLKILSTVYKIMVDFINKNNPQSLLIHPTEKDSNKNQKSDLYKAFLSKSLSKIPNYSYSPTVGGFLVYKK